jgi:hypothetical protein
MKFMTLLDYCLKYLFQQFPIFYFEDLRLSVRWLWKSSIFWGIMLCSSLKALLATCFMLVYCLAYISSLKMETTCFSETSLKFKRTMKRCIRDDRNLHLISSEDFPTWHALHYVQCSYLLYLFICWNFYTHMERYSNLFAKKLPLTLFKM